MVGVRTGYAARHVSAGPRSATASSSRRYAFYDQNIGVVLGDAGVLLVDTRISHRQAAEILADLRAMTRPARPASSSTPTATRDHCLRQPRFRPADDLGPRALRDDDRDDRRAAAGGGRSPRSRTWPTSSHEVVFDPPDRTFAETRDGRDRAGRAVGRAALSRPRPHRQRHRRPRPRRRRAVRRRPAGERRDAVLRRRLPDRLAGHRRAPRRAGDRGRRARPRVGRRPRRSPSAR